MEQHSLGSSPDLIRWQVFRERIYTEVFTQGRDALFELLDALLEQGPVPSLVELSLSPFFRRAWPSVYAALRDGRIDSEALGRLAVDHLPPVERPLLVLDGVPWLLPEADTLPDRGVQHVATTLYTREKLGVGYAYSTLGVVPEERGSWFLPLSQERVPTCSDDRVVGAQQVRRWAPQLPRRGVLVVDSKYGEGFLDLLAPLEQPLTPNAKGWQGADPADSPVDVLGRLKGNRTFYFRPGAYSGQGRPRVHGAAFRFQEESTWPEPDREEIVSEPRWGQVRLRAWHHLHSKEHPEREVTIVLIERGSASGSRREPKRLWLFWYGIDQPALVTLWRWYERRFPIEHWHRFGKQTLNWTVPHLTEAGRLGRWGQVVMLATWQLWLARPLSAGVLRPWQQRSVPPEGRTPGQVRQGMGALLGKVGTPAQAPQRRGQSPGRPGSGRGRRPRYPVVKKGSRPAGKRTPQPLAA